MPSKDQSRHPIPTMIENHDMKSFIAALPKVKGNNSGLHR